MTHEERFGSRTHDDARSAATVVDLQLVREINSWLTAPPGSGGDGLGLARLVMRQVRRSGKHLLGGPLLAALSDVQHRHLGNDAFLDAFLDSVLDRHQNRFVNQTYLALPLLGLILADPHSGLDPEALSALLMADVVRHESQYTDTERTDPETRRKRVRHASRFVSDVHPTRSALPAVPRTAAGAWFEHTVLPVSVVHDEYFFIRALQAHEMVFTTLTAEVQGATEALRAGRIDNATATLLRANEVFQRAAMLFRIVATMRAEQFHSFRRFTEGASAIQSEAYKRFEIACGEPAEARIRSEAFAGVPVVEAEASRQDNVARAYLDLRRSGRIERSAWHGLVTAVDELEAGHQRWKSTHHRLAVRMLGDAPGSGYTAGVPYLRQCLDNRLFPLGHRKCR
jgi:tryptophan 2,3-dioxygenase